MAYVQRITPPINRVMNFSLKDFSGGMNNRSDQIGDNEGAVTKNLMFADDTILETRYGQKYYNDKDYGGKIIYIDEYKPYTDDNMLVVAVEIDTVTAIEPKPELEPFTTIVKTYKMYIGESEFDIKGKPSGVTHFGRYYFSDGEKLKVFANFTNTKEGENPITQKEDLDKEGVKSVVYHKYIGTPLASYQVYDVVSPADKHVQLTAEHLRGVSVVDYTLKKVYYEPCANEYKDHLLGACVIPEKVKYVVSHTGRLFVSGHDEDDDNIFISDLQNPLYYAVGLPLQVPPSSDKIRGLHVFDDSVVVGREHDIYVVSGDTNRLTTGVEAFKLKRLNTHTGFASHSAVNIAHNYLIFLGSDGNVYALQNTKTYERDLATMILSKTINLEVEPINIDKKDYTSATSFFHNDEWYLSVGDKVMVYSYRHMAWVMYTSLNICSAYGIGGEWIWGRPEGKIATFDKETFLDFGQPYESLWYSKMFDMDDANSFKQFREFFLVAHTYGEQFSDIYVTFEVDYEDIRDRIVISNQISIWGKAVWGDRFITRNINESLPFVIGRRGRNIRFKISNGYEKDGEIATILDVDNNVNNLDNYPGKKDGTLVYVIDESRYYLYIKREWLYIPSEEMNQRMKIYQINGDYELRGKR